MRHAAKGPGFCTEHGTTLVDAGADSLLGQRVGSYRVARLIGEGGMGRHTLAVGWGPQGAIVLHERGDQRLEGTWAQPGGKLRGTEVLRTL